MQLTVKEALSYLKDPEEVRLICGESALPFNFRNRVEVEAWGDYLVGDIFAAGMKEFEVSLDVQPHKKEAAAV